MPARKQPNILIFQADQLAAPAMGLYGGFALTPTLERLSQDGTLFENAYCNYPLCAPSRFSMMTGQLPMLIGAYDNAAELPASIPTFAHYLRRAGYHTCLSGKMHFIGPDQLHGFEERLTTEIYPADFAWLPDWEKGEQTFAPIRNTIENGGVCAWNMQLAYDEDVTFQAVRRIYEYARTPSDPFCMVVSLTHPHHPFLMTPEYWDRLDHSGIPEPTVGRLADGELDPHSRRARRVLGLDESDVTLEQARNARHAYYAAIAYVDDKIGEVLKALEAVDLDEDTAIFLVADHGEMLGERGLWAKDCFFEGAMRIPFLMKLPGAKGGDRIEENVSLLDLMPTLLDLAGIDQGDVREPLRGQSLCRLLEDPGQWPDRVLAEYSAEAAEAPMVMIRQGRHKYIHGETDPPLLFDLKADPHELHNLAGQASHKAEADEFAQQVRDGWDLKSIDRDIRISQQRRMLVGEALATGRHEPWDYQPRPDHSNLYVREAAGGEVVDRRVRVAAKGHRLPGGE